jgi:predicted amidohydrolase YtcJ
MKKTTHFFTVLAPAACLALITGCAAIKPVKPTDTVDIVYFGGDILTMDGAKPAYAEAVAVKDGKIAYVGTKAEALKLKGGATEIRDLSGKALLPGFVDGHSHFMMAVNMAEQVNVSNPPVGPATDIPSTIAILQAFKSERNIPAGEWIVGWGYDGTQLKEGRDITKTDLDTAFPDNKVLLIHVSGHGGVFNSRALEWAGITRATPTPPGGIIARMKDGKEPAGLLMETAYIPTFAKLPQPAEAKMLDLLKDAQNRYATNGYTLAVEGFTHAKEMRFLQKGAAQDRLFIDIVSLPGFVDVQEWMDNPEFPTATWNRRLKFGGLKITQDGSPQGKTAFITTPFLTGGPDGQSNWRGETTQPYPDFAALVKKAHQKGYQVHIHANGDGTIDQAIKAVDAAGITAKDDARTIVIHSQFQRPDQLPRYKALGMSPSYFTNHTFFWGDVHRRNIGEDKAAFISPMKSAIDQGIIVSNHSDFNVTPLDPMFILWTSMARTTRSGFVLGANQRVDAYTGLQALTTGPAWQFHEENRRGRIKPGMLADFVILSANPVKADVAGIRDIKVLETVKEGKTVYGGHRTGQN